MHALESEGGEGKGEQWERIVRRLREGCSGLRDRKKGGEEYTLSARHKGRGL